MSFWELREERMEPGEAEALWRARGAGARRFVVHRHRDAAGAHLDVRLEQDGYLLGWRVDGGSLEEGPWATEKAPHPVRWLEQDGDAVREDAGEYVWLSREEGGGELLLKGASGYRRVRVGRAAGLPARCVRALRAFADAHGIDADGLAGLAGDGRLARERAVARLCGLGLELDGAGFDPGVWRRTLSGLPLEEVHAHLRSYEVRFDAKYPPAPVSRAERLGEGAEEGGAKRAMALLNG